MKRSEFMQSDVPVVAAAAVAAVDLKHQIEKIAAAAAAVVVAEVVRRQRDWVSVGYCCYPSCRQKVKRIRCFVAGHSGPSFQRATWLLVMRPMRLTNQAESDEIKAIISRSSFCQKVINISFEARRARVAMEQG